MPLPDAHTRTPDEGARSHGKRPRTRNCRQERDGEHQGQGEGDVGGGHRS